MYHLARQLPKQIPRQLSQNIRLNQLGRHNTSNILNNVPKRKLTTILSYGDRNFNSTYVRTYKYMACLGGALGFYAGLVHDICDLRRRGKLRDILASLFFPTGFGFFGGWLYPITIPIGIPVVLGTYYLYHKDKDHYQKQLSDDGYEW